MFRKSFYIISSLIFLIVLSPKAQANECGTLNVGWIDWPPYQYSEVEGSKSPKGIDIEFAELVFSELGCNLSFAKKPWARLLKDFSNKKIDLLLGMSKTKERLEIGTFSNYYRSETLSLFVSNQNSKALNLRSLADIERENLVISIPRNGYLGSDLKKLVETEKYKDNFFENVGPERIEMLAQNRIQGILMDTHTGIARINNSKFPHLIVPNKNIIEDLGKVYFMLQPKRLNEALLIKLNQIINETRDKNLLTN